MNILSQVQQTKLTQKILDTNYSIPAHMRAELTKYYVLRWSKPYFELQPNIDRGFLHHQGQRYEIAYAKFPLIERRINRGKDSVMLSFRCPTLEAQRNGLRPTVYVTMLQPIPARTTNTVNS